MKGRLTDRALRKAPRFHLTNRSGYETQDLVRYFARALAAYRIRTFKRIVVVASPIRTRGCAEVSGDRCGASIVIAIASPSKLSYPKLARIVEHECNHARGLEHEDMARHDEKLLYSEGRLPAWARGLRLRYRGRAPDQMADLGPSQKRRRRVARRRA